MHDTLAFPATSITQNVSAAYLLNVWIVYGVYNTDDRSRIIYVPPRPRDDQQPPQPNGVPEPHLVVDAAVNVGVS